MAYLLGPKEKKSRALGVNLFLKAERSGSQKSAMVRRPYRPGMHGKARRSRSEFGLQLAEKQKLRLSYGLRERQLVQYVKEALRAKDITTPEALSRALESRLDSLVFRVGFAPSRSVARFLVSHGHCTVDGRRVDIPSMQLKPGQIFAIRLESKGKKFFENLSQTIKKHEPPSWISLDRENWTAKVASWPTPDQLQIPFNLSLVVEFYSR